MRLHGNAKTSLAMRQSILRRVLQKHWHQRQVAAAAGFSVRRGRGYPDTQQEPENLETSSA